MTDTAQALLDAPAHVLAIEACLDRLDAALRGPDPLAIDVAASALQKTLAGAMAAFHHANAEGHPPMAPDLVSRLVLAQSRVTALQPVLQRAIASFERTLSVLLTVDPHDDQATYLALGAKAGASRGGVSYKG